MVRPARNLASTPLSDFREQYPQFKDFEDDEILTGLYEDFYTDVSDFETFKTYMSGGDLGAVQQASKKPKRVTPAERAKSKLAEQDQAVSELLAPKPKELSRLLDVSGSVPADEVLTEEGSGVIDQVVGAWQQYKANWKTARAISAGKDVRDARASALGRRGTPGGGIAGLGGSIAKQARAIKAIDGDLYSQRLVIEEMDASRETARAALQSAIDERKETLAKTAGIHPSEATREMLAAESLSDAVGAFATDPVRVAIEISAQSAPHMTDAIVLGTAGALLGGAGGQVAGMGLGSGASEFRASFAEGLLKEGVDLGDANSILTALDDEALMGRVRDKALARGAIIGSADAASAGLARVGMAPFIKSAVGRAIANQAAQTVTQAAFGAGGEAAAQLATEGDVHWGEVVAEAVGEGATSVVEVGSATLTGVKKSAAEAVVARAEKKVRAAIAAREVDEVQGETTPPPPPGTVQESRVPADPPAGKGVVPAVVDETGFAWSDEGQTVPLQPPGGFKKPPAVRAKKGKLELSPENTRRIGRHLIFSVKGETVVIGNAREVQAMLRPAALEQAWSEHKVGKNFPGVTGRQLSQSQETGEAFYSRMAEAASPEFVKGSRPKVEAMVRKRIADAYESEGPLPQRGDADTLTYADALEEEFGSRTMREVVSSPEVFGRYLESEMEGAIADAEADVEDRATELVAELAPEDVTFETVQDFQEAFGEELGVEDVTYSGPVQTAVDVPGGYMVEANLNDLSEIGRRFGPDAQRAAVIAAREALDQAGVSADVAHHFVTIRGDNRAEVEAALGFANSILSTHEISTPLGRYRGLSIGEARMPKSPKGRILDARLPGARPSPVSIESVARKAGLTVEEVQSKAIGLEATPESTRDVMRRLYPEQYEVWRKQEIDTAREEYQDVLRYEDTAATAGTFEEFVDKYEYPQEPSPEKIRDFLGPKVDEAIDRMRELSKEGQAQLAARKKPKIPTNPSRVVESFPAERVAAPRDSIKGARIELTEQLSELSPEQQAVLEAVTIYTKGDVAATRDPSRFKAEDAGVIYGPRLKGSVDQFMLRPTREDYSRSKVIIERLASAPALYRRPLYRGMRMPAGDARALSEGQVFDMGRVSSFSRDQKQAETYEDYPLGKTRGGASVEGTVPVLFRVDNPVRGTDISGLSAFPGEEEFVTSGRFRVQSVQEYADRARVVVRLEQVSEEGSRVGQFLDAHRPVLDMQEGTNYVAPIGQTGALPINAQNERVLGNGRVVRIPKKPVRREHILGLLERKFGLRIYQGRVKGPKTRLGFYRTGLGEVRIRKANDLETAAHEVAHWLDEKNPWMRSAYEAAPDEMKGVSYDDQSTEEGFAEFFRLFLTQEDQAIRKAPGFYDAFRKQLDRRPELRDTVFDIQELMHAWHLQGARARLASKIGFDAADAFERIRSFISKDSIMQKALDGLRPIRTAELDASGGAETEAYNRMRLVQGSSGVLEATFFDGTPGWRKDDRGIEITGESLKDIFGSLFGNEDVAHYFIARRGQELMDQGRENLIRADEIAAGLAVAQTMPEVVDMFERYQRFNKRMLDFAQGSGLLSAEGRAAMEEMNQSYVPFHRVATSMTDKKPVVANGNPFMRLRGGTQNLNSVWDNMVNNTGTIIRVSMINDAKRTLYKKITDSTNQRGALYATPIDADSRQVSVPTRQVMQKLVEAMGMKWTDYIAAKERMAKGGPEASVEEAGVVEVVDRMAAGAGDFLQVMQLGVDPTGEVDVYLDNGKKKFMEIADPGLWEALKFLGPKPTGLVTRIMGAFSRTLRRGVTAVPVFQVKNFVRDTTNAWLLSGHQKMPVVGAMKGMWPQYTRKPEYVEMLLNGGGFANRSQGLEAQAKSVVDPRRFFAFYDRAMGSFENANRLAEYSAAKKAGVSPREAALLSREISTDFAMRGSSEVMRNLAIAVPFLNARIQGLYRIGKQFSTAELRNSYLLRGSMLTVATLALYALNKDDDRYEEMPEDVKDLYWVFFTGEGEDEYVLLPKPFESGMLFATMPERMFELVEEREGKEFADAMLWMFTETFSADPTPQVFQPWRDLMRNKNFTGAPIVPRYLEGPIEPSEQFKYYTSRTVREAGRKLNLSPLKTEHLIRGYAGTLGTYMMAASDAVIRATAGPIEEEGEEPTRGETWRENILVKAVIDPLVREGPPRRTKFTTDLYDMVKEVEKVVNTADRMQKRRAAELEEYMKDPENERLIALNPGVQKIKEEMALSRSAMRALRTDPEMSGDEKRVKLWKMQRELNKLARDAVVALKPLMEGK